MLSIKEISQKDVEICFELDSNSIALWNKEQWESEFNKKGIKVYALFKSKKIIGICSFQVVIDEAQINYFLIKNRFRRKGYGSYLMNYLINACIKLNLRKLLLEVSDGNLVAQKFYGCFDFLSVGRRKKYYKDGTDAVLKEKFLIKK